MADPCTIETVDLRKQYAGVDALAGLNLQVPAGSISALLGRNGAGKTTAIKILIGLVRPTGGVARVFGLPADREASSVEIRRRTGFVSEEKDLCGRMRVDEIIRFTAGFHPRWRADLERRYLDRFELPPDRRVRALSRGGRTKLAILLALCRGASLLVLDEPTAGLDPAAVEEVLQAIVAHVAGEETTVLFSSHQIAEVEQIADHVAIVDRGRAVRAGALDDLRARHCRIELVFEGDAPAAAFASPGVERIRRDGRQLTILSSAGPDALVAEARRLGPTAVHVTPVTLREIFLEAVHVEA